MGGGGWFLSLLALEPLPGARVGSGGLIEYSLCCLFFFFFFRGGGGRGGGGKGDGCLAWFWSGCVSACYALGFHLVLALRNTTWAWVVSISLVDPPKKKGGCFLEDTLLRLVHTERTQRKPLKKSGVPDFLTHAHISSTGTRKPIL